MDNKPVILYVDDEPINLTLLDHLILKYFRKPFNSHEIKSTLTQYTKDVLKP